MNQFTESNSNFDSAGLSGNLIKELTKKLIDEQTIVDHPIITQCTISSPGLPSFVEGSPYLFPETLEFFINAMRDDVCLMHLETAKQVFRNIDRNENYPLPESCTPYTDANSLGYYLKPMLPLLFVRTTKGESLLEARVALKYIRENARRFNKELKIIEYYTERILRKEFIGIRNTRFPFLLTDIVQPYNAFTDKHVSLRAGLWVHTPPGVNTLIAPPINNSGPFSVLTGSIETDWHHFELFVVIEIPAFEGQVRLIEPDQIIAQLYFVSRSDNETSELRLSKTDPGAEHSYWKGWERLGSQLLSEGKEKIAERHGVASVQIGCPHCFISVTAAAESQLPCEHVFRRGFVNNYKLLKSEYHSRDIKKQQHF